MLVAGAGVLGFIEIADDTMEGDTRPIDESILRALRDANNLAEPIGPPWLDGAMADVTALGGYAVLTLLVVFVALYLIAIGQRHGAILVAGASLSGAFLSEQLKIGFARPRPDLVDHLVEVHSMSFPSGHAMLTATTYLMLGALLSRLHQSRRLKVLVMSYAVVITLLVGFSRIYLGVHWPSDVLAGWALGAAWAALWWLAAWGLQRRGWLEEIAD